MLENPPKPLTDHDVPNVSVGNCRSSLPGWTTGGQPGHRTDTEGMSERLSATSFFFRRFLWFSPNVHQEYVLRYCYFQRYVVFRNLLCRVCLLKFDCHCQCSDKFLLFCSSLPMQRKNKPKEYPQQQESSGRRSQTVIPYKRGSFCFMTKQCRAFLRRPARRPPLLLLLLLQQQHYYYYSYYSYSYSYSYSYYYYYCYYYYYYNYYYYY